MVKEIGNPFQYYRQYVGIVVSGRKLIYLNAVCKRFHNPGWRNAIEPDVCDSGCNWGVVYDPETHLFSHWERDGAGPPPIHNSGPMNYDSPSL